MGTDLIRLGPLEIAACEYAIQGNAILGIKDSGKSYASMFLAERLMDAGVPIIAFDPIGVWRFLQVGAKGAGYPIVVAGGEHGNLPLSPESAPEIVRAAMREGVSLVLDLYSMELSKADWKRIVQSSVRTLLYENKAFGLRHIFIEEAAEFAPQFVGRGDADGKVYAEIEKLARMGGNAQLGYTLINQRAEEVNKAVLELCDSLYLFRQKGKNSLLSLGKWLDAAGAVGAKEIVPTLPTMPQGECWAWVSGSDRPLRVKIPEKRTFHPDRRQAHDGAPVEREPVNVSAFVERMSALLTTPEPEAVTERDVEYIVDDEENNRLRGVVAELEEQLAQARSEAQEAHERLGQIALLIGAPMPVAPPREPERAEPPPPTRPREAAPPVKPNGHAHGKLAKAERSVLTALAQYPQGRTKTQVAILGAYAVTGGGFNNALSALRSQGYIEGGGDHLKITAAGLKALGPFQPLPRGRALLDHWLRQLDKAPRTILEAVAKSYPRPLTKEAIAAQTDYEAGGGGFNNALSRLRTLELITRGHDIKASDALFGR